MAERKMGDLDKTVSARLYIEVNIAHGSQIVVSAEARERRDAAPARLRHGDSIENVRRAPGTADCHQQIAGAQMKLELLGEHLLISQIIGEAGLRRRIVECHPP